MTSPALSPARRSLPVPPVVPGRVWLPRFVRQWEIGGHLLVAGPTQTGKTVLARELIFTGRKFVVIIGTKTKDASLDEYIRGGFVRIDHWPPVSRDFKDQPPGFARFILWPKIKEIGDLHRFKPLYEKALRSIYVDGRWTVVIDETLWVVDTKDGLGLGHILATMAYGVASNECTMVFLMQRPSGVPRLLWANCSTALLFHLGVTNDIREMAALGRMPPKAVVEALQTLGGDDGEESPHQFLDLPLRAGRRWAISELEL